MARRGMDQNFARWHVIVIDYRVDVHAFTGRRDWNVSEFVGVGFVVRDGLRRVIESQKYKLCSLPPFAKCEGFVTENLNFLNRRCSF